MPLRKADLEAPEAEAPAAVVDERVGEFVGLGLDQVSTLAGEWVIDPETGCITGRV